VDDVGAVAILHALAREGKAEILAMGACSSSPWATPCLDALNTYFGKPDIPLGAYKGKPFLAESSYSEAIAGEFPNDLKHGDNAPEAVGLYRRVLAEHKGPKVMFIAVGPLNNLAALLESGPDASSSLGGLELIEERVGELVVMGPYFNNEGSFQYAWNFAQDPEAACRVLASWPTPVRFGEGNLGHRHFIGAALSERPAADPVRRAYELAEGPGGKRHCADPSTILYALTGTQYFDEVSQGLCEARCSDGYTRWASVPDKDHVYNRQRLPEAQLERIMENLLIRRR